MVRAVTAAAKDLTAAARLRIEIAALARGGEYDLATARLCELAALDLRAGLTADALLRSRQAATIARDHADLADELKAHLVLAMGLMESGAPESAEAAADLVLGQIGDCPDERRLHLSTMSYLVRGIASRRAGHLEAARVALGQARERAVRLGRADLSALILAELGAVEVAGGDPLAAAVCFGFARDVRRLIGQPAAARVAAVLAVAAFVEAGEVALALGLVDDALAEAERADDGLAVARLAAGRAEALLAAGDVDGARIAADRAAELATLLPDDDARHELGIAARLCQLRLEAEPGRQLMHLEAAVDHGLGRRDAAALARAIDTVVTELVTGARPPEAWTIVAALAQACHGAGLGSLASLAAQALAELR